MVHLFLTAIAIAIVIIVLSCVIIVLFLNINKYIYIWKPGPSFSWFQTIWNISVLVTKRSSFQDRKVGMTEVYDSSSKFGDLVLCCWCKSLSWDDWNDDLECPNGTEHWNFFAFLLSSSLAWWTSWCPQNWFFSTKIPHPRPPATRFF